MKTLKCGVLNIHHGNRVPIVCLLYTSESVPEQREARRSMSLELLRRCRVLVVCSDELTEEMEAEILLAKRLGMVTTTLTGIKKISLHTASGGDEA